MQCAYPECFTKQVSEESLQHFSVVHSAPWAAQSVDEEDAALLQSEQMHSAVEEHSIVVAFSLNQRRPNSR